jgi:hypothetical protein
MNPAARLVPDRNALDVDPQPCGIAAAGRFQIAPRFALEEVADAAIQMGRLAGDAHDALAAIVGLGPDRAAHAAAMHDAMRDAAQRNLDAMHEGRRFRQALEPRRDPSAVLLREVSGFPHDAARRHGEHDLARGGIDAQRVAARLAVPAQAHQEDRFVENDFQRRWFSRTTIE